MVTKGIITEIINKYQARVRIPIYNKAEESPTATPNEELSIGPVNTLPGINPNISVGDVVIIAFEQDIYTDPVILGLLYTENSSRGFSDVKAGELSVISEAILPSKTTIGSVKGDQIASLENVKGNIQNQIDLLSDKFTEITESSVYDVKVAGTSVVTDGIANIPYADASTSGVVSTGAQTIAGTKTFAAWPVVRFSSSSSSGLHFDFSDKENKHVGGIYTAWNSGEPSVKLRQFSSDGTNLLDYYELFSLPSCTQNLTNNKSYTIITTKNLTDIGTIPVTQGGTGATTAADARTNLGVGASGTHADSYFALASHTHNYAGSSSAGGAANSAIKLDHITLNSTTINNTAGSFAFSGSGDPWSGTDWVGLQIGDNVDKFQISANSNTIVFRQNDNGGTSTSWSDWVTMLTSANYTSYAAPASHTHNYAGSSSAGGAATNVNLTSTTGSGTSYYITFATGNSGSQALRANDHFYIYDTASETWINSGKSGRKGGVTLWNGSYYNNLAPNASLTANRTITFPNASGTVSLEGHTHDITTLTNYSSRVYDATVTRTANTVLAAPNGSNGTASFRKLAVADLPTSNILTRQGWWASGSGQNVNDLKGGSTFVYTTHSAPTNGTMVALDCSGNTNYTAQLIMGYNDGTMYWRARNGDNSTWSDWKAATPMVAENGYWGIKAAGGGNDWIRTTSNGLIPYQSGGSGSGHCGLGTSSWYFSYAYIDSIYTTSGATGFKCRNISYGSGDPSGGSSGDIYIKFV